MWPGRRKSSALERGLDSAAIVAARSDAEMPVLVPARRSQVTVKAVYMDSLFSDACTISGSPSRSASRPLQRGAHHAAGVGHHEVQRLGRGLVRGHHQVALVLARRVVQHHHALPRGDGAQRGLDGVEAGAGTRHVQGAAAAAGGQVPASATPEASAVHVAQEITRI